MLSLTKEEVAKFLPPVMLLLGAKRNATQEELFLDKDWQYPLKYGSGIEVGDETVDVLETWTLPYFPYQNSLVALEHWTYKLKPGGVLRIVVPNFLAIVDGCLKGVSGRELLPLLHGPQSTPDDCYRSSYNDSGLADMLRRVGLIDVKPFKETGTYIHLEGMKPLAPVQIKKRLKVGAVISVPRLGFMDNFGCVYDALSPLGIGFRRCGGAFWGESLQCAIEEELKTGPELVLVLDYDTVFTSEDVVSLERLMREYPSIDALAPLQSNRHNEEPLFAMDLPFGVSSHNALPVSVFKPSVVRATRAHFGLTMLRASSLAKVPKPWFLGHAAPDGTYTQGKLDADTAFWKKFEQLGLNLSLATRVKVGHIVEMVKWPGKDMQGVYQNIDEYRKKGKPDVLD